MNDEENAVIGRLREAAEGLLFQSESDFPVEPFLLEGTRDEPLTGERLLKRMQHAPDTPLETTSLEQFFEPAARAEDWHGPEERRSVRRFQELVRRLQENLAEIQVFKVGATKRDVYVVGRTRSGNLAGVRTKVVET